MGAVVVEGPKACGKTATARQHAASEVLLDIDQTARTAIGFNPNLVLEGPTPRPIDEWQVVPEIWNHVRRAIDDRQEPGQFILTGSAVPADDAVFMRVGSAVFEVVKKEVVLADRIVGFRQWEVQAWGQQAIDLPAAFGNDLDDDWLRGKLQLEGSLDALDPLRRLAESEEPVSRDVLGGLLKELRGTSRGQ